MILGTSLAGALLLGGCGTMGTWGNNLPEGSLAVSLSEGLHSENRDVPYGTEYTIRFTLRNTESAPIHLRGLRIRATFGDVKFIDALATVRESGDREARVFKGYPPTRVDADLGPLANLTDTTVKAHQVVDIVVGFTYNSGDQAGIEGLDVLYEIQGRDEVTAVDVELEFCQGDLVDRDGCADRQIPLHSNVDDTNDEDSDLNSNL